ncbi:MAG TPA: diguanylate cyclase [Chloroflexia bacterium]|nr:diguanylate cyclase [Chloroflexia bacterium]
MTVPSVGSQSVTVLVIDPDPLNQRAMRDQLMRLGYTARSTDDYDSALAILEATPPDVVLLVNLPIPGEGWEELQANLKNWGIPLITLTGMGDGFTMRDLSSPDQAVQDVDLRARLDAALQSRQAHEALVMENARLSGERLYDPITGLFNRRYMMIRVEEEIKRSSRHAYPLSCLLLDIDGFDAINEKWGNHTGDAILRDISHIMTRTLRATDIVARYRDDEFIGLLTDTDATGAQIAANRLRDAVAIHHFNHSATNERIELTVSIGVAYWHPTTAPGEGTWEPQLIGLAERALKAAKLSGPNRLVMLQAA